MQVSEDTRKQYSYNKLEGTWAWFYRSDENKDFAHHTGFETFLDALMDATEPYFNNME
jgi:hypothetical protein